MSQITVEVEELDVEVQVVAETAVEVDIPATVVEISPGVVEVIEVEDSTPVVVDVTEIVDLTIDVEVPADPEQIVIEQGQPGPAGVAGLKGDKGDPGGVEIVPVEPATSTWVLPHSFPYDPLVRLQDSAGDEIMLFTALDVTFAPGEVTVTLDAPVAGKATLQ